MQISIDDLDKFAAAFWNHVKEAKVFAFHGGIGAGKTTIIKALCKYKGVMDNMSSPTFSIINEYGYKDEQGVKKIFHIDLYRLENAEEAIQAGVEECVNSGSVCFVEWPEKTPELFDEETWHVMIEQVNENNRAIKIQRGV
jgi:tRNA threonylcarbamoyladenosine biosynthesis protein TsaE